MKGQWKYNYRAGRWYYQWPSRWWYLVYLLVLAWLASGG